MAGGLWFGSSGAIADPKSALACLQVFALGTRDGEANAVPKVRTQFGGLAGLLTLGRVLAICPPLSRLPGRRRTGIWSKMPLGGM
jgi:hypothetical protein